MVYARRSYKVSQRRSGTDMKNALAVVVAYIVFIGGGMLLEQHDNPRHLAPVIQVEEDSPFWQCARQGNFLCGDF